MKVEVSSMNGFVKVTLAGRVDTTNANEFEKAMLEVVESGTSRILLNCAELNYISSSGLRVFLIVQKKMSASKGKFDLCSLRAEIKEIFDISGFTSIFSIFPDEESAIKVMQ